MALELMLPGSTSGFRRSSSSRSCWLLRAISSDEKSHRLCKCSLVTRSRRLCKCSLATRSRRRSLFVVNSLAEHRWYRRWVAHDVENSLARAATLRVSACGRIAFEVGFSTSLCHVEEAFERPERSVTDDCNRTLDGRASVHVLDLGARVQRAAPLGSGDMWHPYYADLTATRR